MGSSRFSFRYIVLISVYDNVFSLCFFTCVTLKMHTHTYACVYMQMHIRKLVCIYSNRYMLVHVFTDLNMFGGVVKQLLLKQGDSEINYIVQHKWYLLTKTWGGVGIWSTQCHMSDIKRTGIVWKAIRQGAYLPHKCTMLIVLHGYIKPASVWP